MLARAACFGAADRCSAPSETLPVGDRDCGIKVSAVPWVRDVVPGALETVSWSCEVPAWNESAIPSTGCLSRWARALFESEDSRIQRMPRHKPVARTTTVGRTHPLRGGIPDSHCSRLYSLGQEESGKVVCVAGHGSFGALRELAWFVSGSSFSSDSGSVPADWARGCAAMRCSVSSTSRPV